MTISCHICSIPADAPHQPSFVDYNGKWICDNCQEGLEDWIASAKERKEYEAQKALYEQEHNL